MQNNYIKELAIKSYQEEITREYINSRKSTFHYPSFFSGLIAAVFLVGFFFDLNEKWYLKNHMEERNQYLYKGSK